MFPRDKQNAGHEPATLRRSRRTSERPRAATWDLLPIHSGRIKVPFRDLLRSFLDSDFSEAGMMRALDDVLNRQPDLAEFLDSDAPVMGSSVARPELIFEQPDHWALILYGDGGSDDPALVKAWRVSEDQLAAGVWRQVLDQVIFSPPLAISDDAPSLTSGTLLRRREHASVELISSGRTRIIFDPIFLSATLGCATSMPPPEPGIAAAFVTHSHSDHFNVPTLDQLASGGAAIYVPPVPQESLLAPDMHQILTSCGIAARCCEWGDLTEVGDITVEALPFYGEQPSAQVSLIDKDVRNWGCCYRADTPDLSVLLLSDSGVDPHGSMLETISDSVSRRGPVDVVLGCLRYFYSPFEVPGLDWYFSVVPVSGLRTDYQLYKRKLLPSTTLGISGIALACAEARAKTFLPYAHGLTGFRQPVMASPFGPAFGTDESTACRMLSEELRRIGVGTAVSHWNPGDRWGRSSGT